LQDKEIVKGKNSKAILLIFIVIVKCSFKSSNTWKLKSTTLLMAGLKQQNFNRDQQLIFELYY